MDYEGYVTPDGSVSNTDYVHVKRRLVDGVQVEIWAEENEESDYFCPSPAEVVCYRVTIADYVDSSKGVTFLIPLDEVWTKERIMQEFESITQQVKNRVDLGIFEMMYGGLVRVNWESHQVEEPEE